MLEFIKKAIDYAKNHLALTAILLAVATLLIVVIIVLIVKKAKNSKKKKAEALRVAEEAKAKAEAEAKAKAEEEAKAKAEVKKKAPAKKSETKPTGIIGTFAVQAIIIAPVLNSKSFPSLFLVPSGNMHNDFPSFNNLIAVFIAVKSFFPRFTGNAFNDVKNHFFILP